MLASGIVGDLKRWACRCSALQERISLTVQAWPQLSPRAGIRWEPPSESILVVIWFVKTNWKMNKSVIKKKLHVQFFFQNFCCCCKCVLRSRPSYIDNNYIVLRIYCLSKRLFITKATWVNDNTKVYSNVNNITRKRKGGGIEHYGELCALNE